MKIIYGAVALMEQLQFFLADDVKAEKHVVVLLGVLSEEAYAILRNLLAPVASKESPS